MTLSLGEAITIIKKSHRVESVPLRNMKQVVIIVPVKDNQEGINKLLDSFFSCTDIELYPKAIVIVDNNSKDKVECLPACKSQDGVFIDIVTCETLGPAAARNKGAKIAIETYHADWLLFMDSDCVFTHETIKNLTTIESEAVGYQLNIVPTNENWLSLFYHSHAILRPQKLNIERAGVPEALITAGTLILANAFMQVGGFSEDFPDAAGEDIFLGIKLRTVGELSFIEKSIVKHAFTQHAIDVLPADMLSFIKRFYRYGKGNRLLELKLLTEMDVEIDKSPKTQSLLSRKDFDGFMKMNCDSAVMMPLDLMSDALLLSVSSTAMYFGYHNYPLIEEVQKDSTSIADQGYSLAGASEALKHLGGLSVKRSVLETECTLKDGDSMGI